MIDKPLFSGRLWRISALVAYLILFLSFLYVVVMVINALNQGVTV